MQNHNLMLEQAYDIRRMIIELSGRGGCFIGASLSCVDIIIFCYNRLLNNVNAETIETKDRDLFLLSKGHDVPALYGYFVVTGILEKDRLINNHLDGSDAIYCHPNAKIPGVDYHSGSLGHSLSVAIGLAYSKKLSSQLDRVFVLLGDGELNEGTIWEGLLVASAKKLDNLIILIDRNRFQANKPTESLIPLDPLDEKIRSFGVETKTIGGHDFEEMEEILSTNFLNTGAGSPKCIIFETVRGKGLPSLEQRADRWFCAFTDKEVEELIEELDGKSRAVIESQSLVVR